MAREERPNILVIWGDDIGITNLSCNSDGLTGYRTPNIDRIAGEGMRFTDSYGEQSCTAGRSSFITGQSVYRTGLSKVGMRYRPAARRPQMIDTGMSHIGIRCLRREAGANLSAPVTRERLWRTRARSLQS